MTIINSSTASGVLSSRGILRTLIVLTLFILSPTLASAATYYVSPGGNDANAGTQALPWRTIQKGASTVNPGDTVIIRNGTYTTGSVGFNRSGTAAAPITFRGENTASSLVNLPTIVSSTSGCAPAFSISANYITVEDIRFSVSPSNVACGYTSSNVAIRCWDPAQIGHRANRIYIDASAHRSVGWKCQQDDAIIENSEVHDAVELMQGERGIVRNNLIWAGPTQAGVQKMGIFSKGCVTDGKIYNNIVRVPHANAIGIWIGGYSGDPYFSCSGNVEARNTVAYNNVVIGEAANVVGLYFGGAHNSAFFNNVVIGAMIGNISGGDSPSKKSPTVNPKWVNNIIDCKGGSAIGEGYWGWNQSGFWSGTRTIAHNNFYNCTNLPTQTNAISGNALFVNPNSDWHLQSGSPAINAGTVASITGYGGVSIDVSHDKDGVARTTPWDPGIFNVGGGTPPADSTLPTVSITAPANGATVSGTAVTVSANASDNVGVSGVQFKLDGANFGAEDTTSPFSVTWNSTTATNGSHTLTAVARDAAGNSTTSASISVSVSNTAPDPTLPTVSITGPANGATVSGTAVTVSANASDNVGVSGVQFKLDGANFGAEDTTSPFSATWNSTTATNGSHTLTAVARDAAGNSTTSASISVSVSNTASCTQRPLNVSAASSDGGFAYYIGGSFGTPADNSANPTRSVLKLFENSLELGPAHSPHANIRNLGQGRFSHWSQPTGAGEALRFAASNNTDPRTNGRSYRYCVPGTGSDSTPPTVSITAPANGATISGTAVTVSANASDNVGVSGVHFKLDGANFGSENPNTPFSVTWNTTTATNGSHTITAVARDAAGNSTTSAGVSVSVNNVASCSQTPLNVSAASSDGGFAYTVVASFGTSADNSANPTRSVLKLFENSLELGPAHSPHANIRNLGQGRFSHWSQTTGGGEALRFAASNNTDPRTNGRSYRYCVPGTPPPPASDTTAPSVPTGLTGVASASQVSLSWKASTDNVGVTGYRVYRNGTQIAVSTSNSYIDGNLVPGTYSYTIAAVDAAGNVSNQSGSVSATITPLSPPSRVRLSLASPVFNANAAAEEET